MANYSKEVKTENGKQVVAYKDGKKYVDGKDVPENVRTALNGVRPGTVLDELGDEVEMYNGKPLATGSITDEKAPTKEELELDDDDLDDDDETPKPKKRVEEDEDVIDDNPAPAPAPKKKEDEDQTPKRRTRKKANADDGSGDEGMSFPRVEGKTVDIFDGKTPHTHVKPVAGFMVPLSQDSYENKTDTEIMEKLRELGKIS